jgi:hypothetical protein
MRNKHLWAGTDPAKNDFADYAPGETDDYKTSVFTDEEYDLINECLDTSVLEILHLDKPTVWALKGNRLLGVTMSGCVSHMGLFPASIRSASKKYDVSLHAGFCGTVLHELGHMYLESCGLYAHDTHHDEDIVEEASRDAYFSGDYKTMKEILDSFVEKAENA